MKANEFRLNNMVFYKGKPAKIITIPLVGGETVCRIGVELDNGMTALPLKYFSPIPLTEKWLLKFGFRKAWGLDDAWTDKNYFLEVYNYEGVKEYDSGEKRVKDMKEDEYAICKEDGYVEVSRPFKYVHQLQNIYFALTGQEL